MGFSTVPTGHTEMPLHIKRAKQIKKRIAKIEVMGWVVMNDSSSAADVLLRDDNNDKN